MYGNERLPGIATSDTYRFEGSLWRGYTEATWFKHVKVTGTIEKDDIILEIDSIKVTNKEDINQILRDKQIGNLIHFKVQHKKRLYDLVLRVTWR